MKPSTPQRATSRDTIRQITTS